MCLIVSLNKNLLMKNFVFLILFISALSCKNNSVPDDIYSPLTWSAMLAHKDGRHEEALTYFQKAFEVIPYIETADIFHAAKSAIVLEKDELAKQYIVDAIKYMLPVQSYYINFFSEFRDREIFSEIDSIYESLEVYHYENVIPEYIHNELDAMLSQDRKIRRDPNRDEKLDEMQKIDNQNISKLIEFTKEYGWIHRGWLILWHHRGSYGTDNYIWQHFKPLIDKGIEEGKVKKGFWARFEDQLFIGENNIQNYGTYSNLDVIDVENVDKRRFEYRLPPFWYLNKIYGNELPNGYVYKEDVFWEE